MPSSPALPAHGPGPVVSQGSNAQPESGNAVSEAPLLPRVQDARHNEAALEAPSQPDPAGRVRTEAAAATVSPASHPRATAGAPATSGNRLERLPADLFSQVIRHVDGKALSELMKTSEGIGKKLTANSQTAAVVASLKTGAQWKKDIHDRLEDLNKKRDLLTSEKDASPQRMLAIWAELSQISGEYESLQLQLTRGEGTVIADAARFGRTAAPLKEAEEAESELQKAESNFEDQLEVLAADGDATARAAIAYSQLVALEPHFKTLNSRGEQFPIMKLINSVLSSLSLVGKHALHARISEAITSGSSPKSMETLLTELHYALDHATKELESASAPQQEFKRKLLNALTSSKSVEERAQAAQIIVDAAPEIPDCDMDSLVELLSFDSLKSGMTPPQRREVMAALDAFNPGAVSRELMMEVTRLRAVFASESGTDPIIVPDGVEILALPNREVRFKLNTMLRDLLNTLTDDESPRSRMSSALQVINDSRELEDELLAADLKPHDEVRSELLVVLKQLERDETPDATAAAIESLRTSVNEIIADAPPDGLEPFLKDIQHALKTFSPG